MRKSVIAAVVATFATTGLLLSQGSQNPHGKLKWDCQDCHTSESWSELRVPMNFDHNQTGFHLAGAHASAQCIGCHKTPQFSHVGTACIDCHADQHQGQLGQTCDNCHTVRDWQSRKDLLELHAQKGFALTGVHAVADCEACHRNHSRHEYAGTPMDCIGCHSEAFASATNPSHSGAGFSKECERCHHAASGTWANATYTHKTFQLTGAHRTIECSSCHETTYDGTSAACFSCHAADFAGTTDPNHVESGFDHNCAVCHSTSFFKPAQYNHNLTAFPLTGKHQTVICTDCHTIGYAGTPSDCWSCHQTDFEGVPDPNHVLANFDHVCAKCHTTAGWTPANFNHNGTAFPLTGAHTAAACIACHATSYAGTPTNCYACHQTDFEGVADPNHVTNNFDHNCVTCHSTTAWLPSSFNHSNTAFPLTGAHTTTACIACHTTGYTGTPTNCYACHQSDFEGVSDPNHVTNNFDHNCATCHSTSGWSPSSFNHINTAFPLTGAHTTAACVACHATGYANTPTTCISCHQSDYQATTNPSHAAANFPNTCQTCHGTTAWVPSTWNHDAQFFPINAGVHASVWSSCATCHVNPSDYAVFECINCHQHEKTSTDAHHSQVNNYQYLSTACYNCHPRGVH